MTFITVRDRKLSLWQSAVEEIEARRANDKAEGESIGIARAAVRTSEMSQAASTLAYSLDPYKPTADSRPDVPKPVEGALDQAMYCCKVAWDLANSIPGDADGQLLHEKFCEQYGDCDLRWVECILEYRQYFKKEKGHIPYRRVPDNILDVNLPADATIALFGDWGTGTKRAIELVEQLALKKPDLAIHLGDIYYSGLQSEVRSSFLDICRGALPGVPLYSLAGNHDMYSGGAGYYWLVDQLGQKASYFCIRNAYWQFLAADTGYNDFDPLSTGVTSLVDEEAAWHRSKIEEGSARGLRTAMLSHHQLFSAYDEIVTNCYVNEPLRMQLADVLDKIDVWFWGHEHRLNIYKPHLGLQRGRCVGCSAVPVFLDRHYFDPRSDVPLVPDPSNPQQAIQIGNDGKFYNNAYAIMKLDRRNAKITYYQMPAEKPVLYAEAITD